MTPHKLNNSLLFFHICFTISSFFSAVGMEAEERWDIMREDVGCAGATAHLIAPRCNNRRGKAAGLRSRRKNDFMRHPTPHTTCRMHRGIW
jgi:hypothetical protein